jgi:TPR repeat protein
MKLNPAPAPALPVVLALAAVVLGCTPEATVGQTVIRDLYDEMQAGRVSLVTAVGNGNSSGTSVLGTLANKTARAIHIGVDLLTPLYLANSGRGQNMIAAQIFLRDGRYLIEDGRSFITLEPNQAQVPVSFIAFCVDLDRDNPSATDRFTTASTPPILDQVMANIADSLRVNRDRDFTAAAQLAVWLAQGEDIESIRSTFDFEPEDETLARVLAFQPDPYLAAARRANARDTEEDPLAGYTPDWRTQIQRDLADIRREKAAGEAEEQEEDLRTRMDRILVTSYLEDAEQGDSEAQTELAFMYYSGERVPKDDAAAVHWYRLAAEQGEPSAQHSLGYMYSEGQGVPEDDAEAVRWLRLAAIQGVARSQSLLGIMYSEGEGVPKDDAEAVRWLRLAAEQGFAAAQGNLGLMYFRSGRAEDGVLAYMWLSLSASQGNDNAQANKTRLVQRMTPDYLAAAELLLRKWTEKHR